MILTRKIGVVVVNYGVTDELFESLASLSHRSDIAVIVVDNYFSTAERNACRALCSTMEWSLVESKTNVGFGAGCNAGAARAAELGCEDILLLNPDATIDLDDLVQLQKRSLKDDRAVLTPTVIAPDPRAEKPDRVWFRGGLISWSKGFAYHSADPAPEAGFDWLTAACIYFRVEAWEELGGFDESYFLYWEDVDFTYRWKRRGGHLIVVDDAVAHHRVGGTQSSSSSGKSTTFIYYNMLNRARFASRHLSQSQRLRWALATPLVVFRVLRHNRAVFLGEHASKYWTALASGTFAGLGMMLKDKSRPVFSPALRAGADG